MGKRSRQKPRRRHADPREGQGKKAQPKPGPKYGNAFLDALAEASRGDSLGQTGEVIAIVKDGVMYAKPWRPKK